MTGKAQSRTARGRQPSASALAGQVVPKPAADATAPGRLTKVAAKVNSEISRKAKGKGAKPTPRTRRDKKGLVLYVDPDVTVALRRLSLDTGASVQALGMDALNLLFKRHGVRTFSQEAEEAVPSGQR